MAKRSKEQRDPLKKNSFPFSHARFQFITPHTVRMEWSANAEFIDLPTLSVPARHSSSFPVSRETTGDALVLWTSALVLHYKPNGEPFSRRNLSIEFEMHGKKQRWFPEKKASSDSPLLGYRFFDDSGTWLVEPNEDGTAEISTRPENHKLDWYATFYGNDLPLACREFHHLFGKWEMPPASMLDFWWQCHWSSTPESWDEFQRHCEKENLEPGIIVQLAGSSAASSPAGSTPNSLPDDLATNQLVYLHEPPVDSKLQTAGVDVRKLRTLVRRTMGGETPSNPALHWTEWPLHGADPVQTRQIRLWFDFLQMEHLRQLMPGQRILVGNTDSQASFPQRGIHVRPASVTTWRGLRDDVEWLAETGISDSPLKCIQPGGRDGHAADAQLAIRWLQLGVHAPFLRLGSLKGKGGLRRFDDAVEPYATLTRKWLLERQALRSYLYSELAHSRLTSLPFLGRTRAVGQGALSAPLADEHSYFLGRHLLVAPVIESADPVTDLASREVTLPDGVWFDCANNQLLEGSQKVSLGYLIEQAPVFAPAGAMMPVDCSPTCLRLRAYPGHDGHYEYLEDDGSAIDPNHQSHAVLEFSQSGSPVERTIIVSHVSGSHASFNSKRALIVELPMISPSAQIEVHGKAIPLNASEEASWVWNPRNATGYLILPEINLKKPTVVHIRQLRKESVLFSGWAGFQTRMRAMRPWIVACSSGPQDRAIATCDRILQTGLRCLQKPEKLAREFATFPEELSSLCTLLLELAANQPDAASRLLGNKAAALAEQTRRDFKTICG